MRVVMLAAGPCLFVMRARGERSGTMIGKLGRAGIRLLRRGFRRVCAVRQYFFFLSLCLQKVKFLLYGLSGKEIEEEEQE